MAMGCGIMQWAIVPLLFVLAQAAVQRVSPSVDRSDKHFMEKDYPFDKRPAADKYYVFDHPYPAVQDTSDYDKDFVKDDNSDGGRWQAQMEYDTLRAKIRAAKAKLGDLKEKMEKEYEEWMRSKVNDATSTKTASEAGKDADVAKDASRTATQKVNDLEGRSSTDGTKVGGAIGDAVKKVKDEMSDLEKCKKKLAEAKERLKEVLKEKEEFAEKKRIRQKEHEAKKAKAEEEKKKVRELKEKKKKERAAAGKDAEDDEDDDTPGKSDDDEEDDFDEEAWKKKLDREKADHAEALKNYEKHVMDVKQTEDQLARAAETLRKFRRPPYVDGNGGVYNGNGHRSNAFSTRMSATIALVVIAALAQL